MLRAKACWLREEVAESERRVVRVPSSRARADLTKGITLAWAKAGAKTIFICGREQNTLDATAAEVAGVSPSTEVVCIPCDVTNEVQVAEMFAKVKGKVGKLDALVCNAGGMRTAGQHLKIGEMETRDWWGDIVSLSCSKPHTII